MMTELDERIKAILGGHEKLKKQADEKKIGVEDYLKKKDFLSDKINPLLDEKIRRLEGEKGELVLRLHGLEEAFESKEIVEAEYDKRHVAAQERLAEIDEELAALHGGKRDIDTLYAPEKPKFVVRRSHVVLAAVACFVFIVFYMTSVLGVNLHLIEFLEKPFRKPSSEGLLSGAKNLAVGLLGEMENIAGFGFVKPLPGTKISSGGGIEATFMKPRLKFVVLSARAFNAETLQECGGDVLVNSVNLTEYGVGVASDDDSFTLEFRGCPSMKSEKTDLKRVGMEVSFETMLGGGSTRHTVSGEVDLS